MQSFNSILPIFTYLLDFFWFLQPKFLNVASRWNLGLLRVDIVLQNLYTLYVSNCIIKAEGDYNYLKIKQTKTLALQIVQVNACKKTKNTRWPVNWFKKFQSEFIALRGQNNE
jgi:hypothetical protein